MSDPTYPLFPICAFLSFVIVLIPFPWHLQSWNSGTCLFMFWVSLSALNFFINSILWRDNVIDFAPVWCDISSRFIVGAAVGIPAASLCINRRLYIISSCQTATLSSRAQKKRAVMIDLAIGLGLPVLQMALQLIVQGHRYDIWEEIGCYPTTVNTPPAYPLSFLWPNVISFISAVYCVLTLHQFMKRRAQFSATLRSSTSSTNSSGLTINRYFRLMCLAGAEILFNIPISSYGLYLNAAKRPIYPWISWADIHFNYSNVGQYPSVFWRRAEYVEVSFGLTRWSVVLCAVVFFGFFGFADEARRSYGVAYWRVMKRFGVTPPKAAAARPPVAPNNVSAGYKTYSQMSDTTTKVSSPSFPKSKSGFIPRPFHLSTTKSTLTSSGTSTLPPYSSSPSRASFDSTRKSRTSLALRTDYSDTQTLHQLSPPTSPEFKTVDFPIPMPALDGQAKTPTSKSNPDSSPV